MGEGRTPGSKGYEDHQAPGEKKVRQGTRPASEESRADQVLLDWNPTATLLLDPEGRVRYCNGPARSLLGRSPDAILGRPFWEFLVGEDPVRFRAILAELSAGYPVSGPAAYSLLGARDGEEPLPVESVVALLDEAGFGPGYALYLRHGDGLGLLPDPIQKLYLAVEQVDEMVVIADREGRIEYVNPAFEERTGWHEAEILGKTPRVLKSGRQPQEFYRTMWEDLLAGRSFHGVLLNRRRDGALYYEEKTITPVRDPAGAVTHFVATGTDVTRQTLDQQRLKASAERLALSLQGADDGLWDWDVKAGRVHLSPRWKTMLGYGEEEVADREESWYELVHPDDLDDFRARVDAHLEGRTPRLESEHRMLHKSGALCWVLVRGLAVRDPSGSAYRMAGSQTDITARKVTEERLQQGALHDALTGLPNRTLFVDRLRMAMNRARRNPDYRFAVLYMDLDRFKIINDGLGHLAGDQLLVEVGRNLRGCLRAADTVARLSGDEFALLVEDVGDEAEAMAFADRILALFSSPFRLEGHEIFTSASIGIALLRDAHEAPSDMLRDADTAMYHAKGHGRSRASVFDDTMHSRALYILELETGLRQAVEAGKLSVHYQPIVSLESGKIAGFEALVRWLHPKRGYIPPAEFIPVAEECGLIHPMGRFVMKEACRRLKVLQTHYPSRPPLTMSVNLSGIQFLRPDLLYQIDLDLREFGLDPRDLKLEITESVIIEHAEHARLMIEQFKAQNIRLSIDDFGTGYSSMANLRKFPIDTVKIDQSFVRKMTDDDECLEIVRATVTMAHNLSMDVIAEGVETAEQCRILKALKCEYGQGYLFSKPVDAEAAEALVARGRIM